MRKAVVCAVCLVAAATFGAAVVAEAAETGLSGRTLKVSTNKKGKSKVVFLSKDAGIEGPSSPSGALLELCSPEGGTASFDLPATDWRVNSKGIAKFKVKGKTDGVKVVTLKPGRTLKIVTGSAGGLDQTQPLVSVGIRLSFDDDVQCALFEGTAVQRDEPGKFQGKDAPAPADCSDTTLGCAQGSPSGAFVDGA